MDFDVFLHSLFIGELDHFDTPEERSQVLREAKQHVLRRRRLEIAGGFFIFALLIGVPAGVFGKMVLDPLGFPGAHPWFMAMVSVVSFGIVVYAWWRVWWKPFLQQFLRQELLKRGIPICLQCGYDLRGLTKARCPECDEPFDERLLAKKPPTIDNDGQPVR